VQTSLFFYMAHLSNACILPNKVLEQCKVKVKLSLFLTNLALRHEGVWGSGCIDPHFLDLGITWR
jgi:hypothetical protein